MKGGGKKAQDEDACLSSCCLVCGETKNGEKYTKYTIYHGNSKPSFLGDITYILGGLKPSFFMVLGSKGRTQMTLVLIAKRPCFGTFKHQNRGHKQGPGSLVVNQP